ncbi:MAG: hypothetical protein IPL71_15060 [Anaerolineales bacterium]|uniref:hypothetical protein n=1 Tax=Candidatus Villigracilis proximus TaxID=3140683 RepID=UPI00313741DA|nr:hypothetical protein [Anaerolineales bacterium]
MAYDKASSAVKLTEEQLDFDKSIITVESEKGNQYLLSKLMKRFNYATPIPRQEYTPLASGHCLLRLESPKKIECLENREWINLPRKYFGDGGISSPFHRLGLDLQHLLDRVLISRFSPDCELV